MDLFEKVSEDIKNAMKAKDKVALDTLRNVKKVFLEAKTAPGANDTLTDADALKIIQKLTKQGKDAAEIYVQQQVYKIIILLLNYLNLYQLHMITFALPQ